MVYNSIAIEGPQEDINMISSKLEEDFAFEALYPVPQHVSDVCAWKRANWGITSPEEIKDLYYNTHRSTRTVKAGVMIGFEAPCSALNWVKKIAADYPEVDINFAIDNNGKDEYFNIDYHEGKRVNNQPTLF